MHTSRLPAVAAVAAALLLVAACGQRHKPATATDHFKQGASQVAQGAKQVATGIKASASDAVITTRVKSNLAANQGLSSFSIHVETTDGVVTLTGHVDSDAARKLAAQVAGKTDGVRVVVDKIEVGKDSTGGKS